MRKIPLTVPCLGEAEARAAGEVILSGWVTQGPRVARFEQDFAECVGAPHACAVSSCTTALHLGLLAAGVGQGDAVITVSHSFIATANAVRQCGAEPFFVDIDPATGNLSPQRLAEVLEQRFERAPNGLFLRDLERLAVGESPWARIGGRLGRLAAILVVHQLGMPADMAAILDIARRCWTPVVEDAACAVGSEVSLDGGRTWERVGRPHGEVACFSFHPRKVLTTGDGGMLCAARPDLDERFRLLRQHGMCVPDTVRHAASTVIFEDYAVTGFNYRMTDIQAAVGIEQIKRLPEILAARRQLARWYGELLAGADGVRAPQEPPYARSNWQSYSVRLDRRFDQRTVMQRLQDRGVASRRGVMCAHLEPPYAAAWGVGALPESEAARDESVILPLYPGMTREDCVCVVRALGEALS